MEDEATVPLYYEKRVPEVHIVNEAFKEEVQAIIDDAALDDEQERQLGRSLGTLYQLITNPDRLDKIAADVMRYTATPENFTRLVTAAQNARAEVWSSDSWPPALSHFCDGAGCSLNEIAS